MKKVGYTYSVVRYLHDPSAGEMLNVGVIFCASGVRYIGGRFDHHYERLSTAFADFDGEHYRRTVNRFEAAISNLMEGTTDTLFDLQNVPGDASALAAWLWPDTGLSFQIGPALAGVTDNPPEALESLFERMVLSQYPSRERDHRTDDEVWVTYQQALTHRKVHRVLRPTKMVTENVELKFDHGFRNERWHLLQPVTMDYVNKETIQGKATRWLGNAVALQGHPELGKLYLLLGRPTIEANRTAYTKAKNLLHQMPIDHELIEEEEAETFANEIREYMRKHRVITDDESE